MTKNSLRFWQLIFIILFASCSHVEDKMEQKGSETVENASQDTHEDIDIAVEKALKLKESGDSDRAEFLASDLYLKASDASMRGDHATATELFAYISKLKPEDYYIQKKYAIELVRNGDLSLAMNLLKKVVIKQQYKEETSNLLFAGVLMALEKKDEAKDVYVKTLKNIPTSEEACIFLAKRLVNQNNYKKAHSLLNKCSKRSPEKGIFAYYKGKVHLKQKQYKSAKRYFKSALKKDKDYYQAALAIGLMLEEKGRVTEAVSHYESFLKESPESYPVLSRLVQIMFAAEMYDQVIPYAEELSSLDQTDLNLKVKLAILYSDSKKYDYAISTFKEILTVVPESDKILYYLASLYVEVKDHELALETFSKIKDSSTLYSDSSMQIAQLLRVFVSQNSEKWEKKYLNFLDEKKEKVKELKLEMAMLKANYLEGRNKVYDAIESLNSVRSEEDYTESHDYYLASLYEKIDKNSEARGLIQEMLDKDPENAHALNYIGYSLLEEGKDMSSAYDYISQAVTLSPNDGYIRDSLAWYFYKTGEYKKALVEIRKAQSLVKDDSVINKHMAMIYTEIGEIELAREFYTKALRYCKVVAEKKEIQKALEDLSKDRLPASSP